MAENPLISVIMSVYNDEAFLAEAINSILIQSEQDFEFIIIDDASTDRSVDIIKGYRDTRIRLYVNSKNEGLTKNLNKGIRLSKGKFIARMDGDDISRPDRFKKQVEYMRKHQNVMLSSCWTHAFGENNSILDIKGTSEQLRVMMLIRPVLMHPGFMMRREIIEEGMLYDETFRTTQDYAFQVQVSKKYDVGMVNCILLNYRMHKKQVSNARNTEQSYNADRVRTGLLERLGLHLMPAEEAIYCAWAFEKRDVCQNDFNAARRIIKMILTANRESKIYKEKILKDELYKLLFQWMVKSRAGRKAYCVGSICRFDMKKWMLFLQTVLHLFKRQIRKYVMK